VIAGETLMVATDDSQSIKHRSPRTYRKMSIKRLGSNDRVVVTGTIPTEGNRVVGDIDRGARTVELVCTRLGWCGRLRGAPSGDASSRLTHLAQRDQVVGTTVNPIADRAGTGRRQRMSRRPVRCPEAHTTFGPNGLTVGIQTLDLQAPSVTRYG